VQKLQGKSTDIHLLCEEAWEGLRNSTQMETNQKIKLQATAGKSMQAISFLGETVSQKF
jgi:hypothetical protein